jgi:ABC-type methionine transport system ATPase subunit
LSFTAIEHMVPALEVEEVFQHVGNHCALAAISLTLDRGGWLLVVGRNGAGKSLLVRLILGLDSPSAGSIRLFGRDLGELDDRAMLALRRERLGAVLQGGSLLEDLTVLENLLLPLRDLPLSRGAMARAARLTLTQIQLDGMENHLPRSLSLGQRRRVELARALIRKPDILVWDGLTDGLDLPSARETLALLRELQQTNNLTLVATDNYPDLPLVSTDRVAVIDRGCLLFQGSLPELEQTAKENLELEYVLGGRV